MKPSRIVLSIGALASCLILFGKAGMAEDGEGEGRGTRLKITNVSLFKNGTGFIVSKGALPGNTKSIRLGQLAVPSFGTFWVGYGKDVRVRSLVASMEDVGQRVPLQNVNELLELNAGRKVLLHVGSDILEGTLMPQAKTSGAEDVPGPYFMGGRPDQDSRQRTVVDPGRSGVMLVKTAKGIVALNKDSIWRADFEGDDLVDSTSITTRRPSIRIELEKPAAGGEVSVSYLARGVSWAPGYLIDLSDPAMAKFSAHAIVVNELTDLNDVSLELVTGFPNVKFSNVASPIALSQSLSVFLNELVRAGSGARAGWGDSRAMVTQQALVVNTASMEDDVAAPTPAYSTAAEGQVAEDLFLYPVKEFSLKRNATAWVPLFSAEMPYKHIYVWKIGDLLDNEDRYRREPETPGGKKAEEVWHSCRLVNNLKIPLTTAAAEFVTEGELTGQDICYFTAPGAETTIRINRAMNVLAEQDEIEVERKRNAAQFYGHDYDLVKVKGELRVRNRMDKPATMEITKEASGEILETSLAAKDVSTAKGLRRVNPKHVLTWKFDLKPGDDRRLTYIYQIYIRG